MTAIILYQLSQATLIVMKCGGIIDWSWWWILIPLWGPFVAVGSLSAVLGMLTMLAMIITTISDCSHKRCN